ncbi:GNAT family N-acetyltransferase [Sphingomonas sp. TDK1]|uniref:GNAT family N-acetyltransferase n=1 Tax=Sphingomonas sp. TDK1 TaxID=453247 RepID=UPI0007D9DA60|nr:GNAT family N-acetyltransferase [Sphingomonas sp. TDK1]OAN59985.1 GCN5 family acetyltransferase [Sphingomonas sp. TDK1]
MIETERLLLRGWTDADRDPFHAMCRDPQVMAFIGPLQTREESDAGIDRQIEFLHSHGHCFWAMERREDAQFLGFCGIKPGAAGTPVEGEIEIGWRLAVPHWGHGYAREAARATLAWTWQHSDAASVAAITVEGNVRSWGLMERLGMQRALDQDFDHPGAIPELLRHRTYRIARP